MLMLGVPALTSPPLIDRVWLKVPPPLISTITSLDWLVILPLLIATAVIVVWRNTSPASDWMLLVALFGVAGAVLAQRVMGVRYGFDVSVEITAAPLLAALTLGRIPFRRMLCASIFFWWGSRRWNSNSGRHRPPRIFICTRYSYCSWRACVPATGSNISCVELAEQSAAALYGPL